MTHYKERDPMKLDELGDYFCKHMAAMTTEELHSKSDIAMELGHRDMIIDTLKANLKGRTLDGELIRPTPWVQD